MAKLIAPTPILKGEDAELFYKLTEQAEANPNVEKAKFVKDCIELYQKKRF